jgi:hypothetical protein
VAASQALDHVNSSLPSTPYGRLMAASQSKFKFRPTMKAASPVMMPTIAASATTPA